MAIKMAVTLCTTAAVSYCIGIWQCKLTVHAHQMRQSELRHTFSYCDTLLCRPGQLFMSGGMWPAFPGSGKLAGGGGVAMIRVMKDLYTSKRELL